MNDHELLDNEQIKAHVNTDAYVGGWWITLGDICILSILR